VSAVRNYAAERVASWIARSMSARDDPWTLRDWGRAVGASVRTLQYVCASAGTSALACKNLARLLRLAALGPAGTWCPFGNLAADARTVRRLLTAGGLSTLTPPETPAGLLVGQTLVRSPEILTALERELRARPEDCK